MTWVDTVTYCLQMQRVDGVLEIYAAPVAGGVSTQVSLALALKMWNDKMIGCVTTADVSYADNLGLPRGTKNPAWTEEVTPPPPGGIIKVYPTWDASINSTMSSTNYGSSANLIVGVGLAASFWRTYFLFDLSSITSAVTAKLKLFYASKSGPVRTLNLHRFFGAELITESSITWDWNAGYETTAQASVNNVWTEWFEFNITDLVKANLRNSTFGLMMKFKEEAGEYGVDFFRSKDEPNASLRPYIEITTAAAVVCSDGTYRCSPTDVNVLQKCVNNDWTGWQSCGYGCDPATLTCKLPPPPPPEETWIDKFISAFNTSISAAFILFSPLTDIIKNTILVGLLATSAGRSMLESFARWLGNKFADDYPEYAILKSAPEGSLSVLAILGIIGAILGFGTLINWARKELPEPSGMAVWAMIEAKDWENADLANKQYISFINKTNGWVGTSLSWLNPFIKTWFDTNRDGQLATAAAYQKIIDANLVFKELVQIISTPDSAKIYIDDVFIFEYTNTTIRVTAGHHKLTLKKDGYYDYSKEFDLIAGTSQYINIILTSTTPPPPLPPETYPTKETCETAGYYWYDNICHSTPTTVPEKVIVIPMVAGEVPYNAWKITIKAVDAETGAEVFAAILINDIYMNRYTPSYFYLYPESEYNIKLRKKGYKQGEVTFTTDPLPEA